MKELPKLDKEKYPLTPENITFFSACRENTGKSLCDSGDFYGRKYDLPPIPEDTNIIVEWCEGCPATISTAVYLSERFDIDRKLQRQLMEFNSSHEGSWFDLGEDFMKSLGYMTTHRDNVCNTENDLDQVFVWETWTHEDEAYDDVYSDDRVITVFYIHTGCDVRGGYGRPLITRATGEYNIPIDTCAGYGISSGTRDGEPLDIDQLQALSENWSVGYSSYPYGQLEEDVEEWFEDTRKRDSVEVKLKTGERVTVYAYTDER